MPFNLPRITKALLIANGLFTELRELIFAKHIANNLALVADNFFQQPDIFTFTHRLVLLAAHAQGVNTFVGFVARGTIDPKVI